MKTTLRALYAFLFLSLIPHYVSAVRIETGEIEFRMLDEQREVPDPIGRGIDIYRECAEQMESAFKERIDEVL